jgi:hypothetical protein
MSVRHGIHQAAQVLKQLERSARTRKAAATSERTQQAARQDTAEAKEAERMAALMIEEGEREEAATAQSKVRGVELAPVRAVSDAVSLGVGVWRSEVPAAAFLWRRLSAQCGMCSGDGAQQKSKAG